MNGRMTLPYSDCLKSPRKISATDQMKDERFGFEVAINFLIEEVNAAAMTTKEHGYPRHSCLCQTIAASFPFTCVQIGQDTKVSTFPHSRYKAHRTTLVNEP